MTYEQYIPFVVFAVMAAFFFSIFILSLFCEKEEELEIIADKWVAGSDKYQYLVKLVFDAERRDNYRWRATTIAIDVRNSRDRHITRFTIPAKILVERTIKTRGTQRVVKCILNRTEEMEDISSIKLSHNCFVGALYIYSLELQDLINKISYMAKICKDIYAVAPNQKIDEQLFKCQINKCERIDDVVKPSKAVTYGETALICYLSVGVIELVCGLFRFCEAMATKCSKSSEFFYSGLLSGVTSGFIFCVLYILLRIWIKVKFSESLASKLWYWIKTGFLVFCSVVGLTCGILGAIFMFSKTKEFEEPLEITNTTTIRPETKFEYMNYVYFSQAFGLFFLLTIVFSFLIILKFLGYLDTTSEPDLELAKSGQSKPTKVIDQNMDRTASVSPQLLNKETSDENLFQENRPTSKESTGTTYYKQLIQNQKDVTSISQYNRF